MLATERILRSRLPACIATIVLSLGALGAYLVARASVREANAHLLRARLHDTTSVVLAISQQLQATLDTTAAHARDGHELHAPAPGAQPRTPPLHTSLYVVSLQPQPQVTSELGPGRPATVATVTPASWNALRRSAEGQIVALQFGASPTVTIGLRAGPDRAVVMELKPLEIARRSFANATELEGAIYIGGLELPPFLLGANTTDLPLRGPRASETAEVLPGVRALVVVSASRPLVGTLARTLPLLALGVGIILAIGVGFLIEALRRRREQALATVEQLRAANADRDRVAAHLVAEEQRYRRLFEDASDAVLGIDATGLIRSINPAGARQLGRPAHELTGESFARLAAEPEDVRLTAFLAEHLAGVRRTDRLDVAMRGADGEALTWELSARPAMTDRGERHLDVIARDVTERRAAEVRLAAQALSDPLTGVGNRTSMRERIEQSIAREEDVTLLLIDLNDFKTVNDSLGHVAGDQLLVELAARFATCIRADDVCARLGGDEFAVVLRAPRSRDHVAQVAMRLLDALDRPVVIEGQDLPVGGAIGIADWQPGMTATELLRNADIAMYAAKARRSGPRVERFLPQMLDAVRQRLELTAEVARAVDGREFALRYQPIVDLETGRIVAVEALARWAHPERGLLAPREFVALAEETGKIVAIGRQVLETACLDVARWRRHMPDLAVTVNISARQLHDATIVRDVVRALDRSALDASALILELTESVLVEGTLAADVLGELNDLGVRIALDDFGAGYSSIDYLRRLPIAMLKIDRSFMPATEQENDGRVLDAVSGLARSLGLATVAEGIETWQQRERARVASCDLGQGYLFSPPLTADDVTALLHETEAAAAAARPE